MVFAALRLRALNAGKRPAPVQWVPAHGRTVKAHSKTENRDAIHFHYDVSNEFYALWLDPAMVYSCAYFENADVDLDAAQEAKLEHICRKLCLQPGDHFLDIGCGWGALVIHAALYHGVRAHGVTLSPQQLSVARQRIAAAGLGHRVTIELRDYRDLPGEGVYDKIASVGMFEHVGLKNLPVYFATVHRLLKPHGLFLNHGITHECEGWRKSLSTEFINRYVFPDGQLDTIGNIQKVMESAKFEIADVEALRPHYALTLRHWVARLERNHARALQYVDEATYRVWRLYMTACALDFEAGGIGIYQILAGKRTGGRLPLPLTRRYAKPVRGSRGILRQAQDQGSVCFFLIACISAWASAGLVISLTSESGCLRSAVNSRRSSSTICRIFVTFCSVNKLICRSRCARCSATFAMRFWRMSTATVINRAFELTTPCSQANGGWSKGRHPRRAADPLTSTQARMNATANRKYAGLPKKRLMRSMSSCSPEICESSRSLNLSRSSRLSLVEGDRSAE